MAKATLKFGCTHCNSPNRYYAAVDIMSNGMVKTTDPRRLLPPSDRICRKCGKALTFISVDGVMP